MKNKSKSVTARLPLKKELQQAQRRRRVYELKQEGVYHKDIAKKLGVSVSLVNKDWQWIKKQDSTDWLENIMEENDVTKEELALLPTNTEEYQEMLRDTIVEMALLQKPQQKIADELGISVGNVNKYMARFLDEVAESGLTLDQQRTQLLMITFAQIAKLQGDSTIEPIQDEDGNWIMNPGRAVQMRNSSSKVMLEYLNFWAKLSGAYQQKQEIKVQTEVVHEWAGVDTSAWPREVVEGDWEDAGS